MRWGACFLRMAEQNYCSAVHRNYTSTSFLQVAYFRYQPAYFSAPSFKDILTTFPLFPPPHIWLYSAPFTIYISCSLSLPALSTSITYNSSTAGRRSTLASSYTMRKLFLRCPEIPHQPTAKFEKQSLAKFVHPLNIASQLTYIRLPHYLLASNAFLLPHSHTARPL